MILRGIQMISPTRFARRIRGHTRDGENHYAG